MEKVKWGMIGCGDVTEIKSGPAFGKVPNSSLVAVMRRDAIKAADYAARHAVPKWYDDSHALINDPEVNAIYIATPPSSHKELALMSLNAGKPVYLEKPMSIDAATAKEITDVAKKKNIKLVVAHYRRQQPKYKKILQLLHQKAIGDVRMVQLNYYRKPLSAEELLVPKTAWRVDASIAGGGLFNDLAPHQLDLMLYFFGGADHVSGIAANQAQLYNAVDIVSGTIHFRSGVVFSGTWCFSAAPETEKDEIEIIGSKGKISFAAFGKNTVTLTIANAEEKFEFDELQHVQQPMIEATVNYFLDKSENPCSGEEGVVVMEWIDKMQNKFRD